MKKSNIIQTLNNEMMNQALADWSKGDYSLLIGAVCTFNADPFLVEYDELAQDVAEEVLQDGVTFKIFERKTCMKTDSGQREAFNALMRSASYAFTRPIKPKCFWFALRKTSKEMKCPKNMSRCTA